MKRLLLNECFVQGLLTILMLWTGLRAYALRDGDDFTFEGIKYTVISEAEKTCMTKRGYREYGKDKPGNNVKGDIVLPAEPNGYKLMRISDNSFYECTSLTSVTIPEGLSSIEDCAFTNCNSLVSISIPQGVTSIGKRTFLGCNSLESLIIPEGITSIKEYTFKGCTSLASVTIPHGVTSINNDAFNGCSSLSSITLPQSLTSIGDEAFMLCSSLTSIIIPKEVASIGNLTFWGCSSLVSVCLPEGITSIGKGAFQYCSSLTSIAIPEDVAFIREDAFGYCTSLASVTIGQGVVSIGNNAFDACSSLTSLTIPKSVTTLGSAVFKGCTLNPLKFEGSYYNSPNSKLLQGLNDGSEVYCKLYSLNAIRRSGFQKVYAYDSKYEFVVDYGDLFKCKCNVIENPYCTTDCSDYKIRIDLNGDAEGPICVLNVDGPGIYEVSDLKPDTPYYVSLSWLSDGKTSMYSVPIRTGNLSTEIASKRSCTSIKIMYIYLSGGLQGATLIEKGIIYNDIKHVLGDGESFVFDNLYPNETVKFTIFVVYSDGKNEYKYFRERELTTEKFSGSIQYQATPTTAELSGGLGNMDDITPDRIWWEIGAQKDVYTGENVNLISLDPDSKINAICRFTYTPEGRETRQFTSTGVIMTPKLELNTLQPKCVSEKCAIVAASTNMSEQEVGAGFEWKKFDAPATLAPSSGSAVVCDGMLEGYIRNLQPTSYYNVRAIYKSASGKSWYGNWVTFDPSDFSYFEPTVRTYPADNITSNSASVRGYALPGTDQFTSQGFQYWKAGSSTPQKIMRVESEINTVIASGQIMTATFENLEPATEYAFRVFVETEQGFTYGDEQKFTTEADTGVASISNDDGEIVIIGYYNLMGIHSDQPHKGLNVVVYSNGMTKKVYY